MMWLAWVRGATTVGDLDGVKIEESVNWIKTVVSKKDLDYPMRLMAVELGRSLLVILYLCCCPKSR